MITVRQSADSGRLRLLLPVLLTPKSGKDEFLPYSKNSDAVRIRIRAVPEDGKANEALLRFLAKQCAVPKSSLELVSGHQSRHKRLSITLDMHEQAIGFCERLGSLIGVTRWQEALVLLDP